MKKLMMLAAILALVMATAIPAAAQVGQESENGDSAVTTDVANEGDHAAQCVTPLDVSNTGNLQAGGSGDGDSEATFSFFDEAEEGALSFVCDQPTQQSADASS